ncbi:LuxR C-terminal-related transcriptional regulator [Agrobacterium arsenijevicii]|uniref:LuxR C-terminal-related transcriptional regulator n=1 Tax=Agrobacterium arsenijevicii TaxID=1585697 RepID=UPI001111CD53
MDAWITSREGAQAADIYQALTGPTHPNVVLAVVDCRDFGIGALSVDFIHRYSIATDAFDFLKLQWHEPLDLKSFPDQQYLTDIAIPALSEVIASKRPLLSKGCTVFGGCRIFHETLILPQKPKAQQSAWCILFSKIDLLLANVPRFDTDGVALGILQLLTDGAAQKEIGLRLELSPRTIEHRIERLKGRAGAKNLQHLVALWISSKLQ